jgi:cell division protein ZapA (FtsZ GTPase activity inhibitor)
LEQLVTINIFGQPFTFKTESDFSRAQEVADFLAREVTRVENQQSNKSNHTNKLAILIHAALNIANENFEIKDKHSVFIKDIHQRSDRLIQSLSDNIGKMV